MEETGGSTSMVQEKKTPDLAQHNPFKLVWLMNAQQSLVYKIDTKSLFREAVSLIIGIVWLWDTIEKE